MLEEESVLQGMSPFVITGVLRCVWMVKHEYYFDQINYWHVGLEDQFVGFHLKNMPYEFPIFEL